MYDDTPKMREVVTLLDSPAGVSDVCLLVGGQPYLNEEVISLTEETKMVINKTNKVVLSKVADAVHRGAILVPSGSSYAVFTPVGPGVWMTNRHCLLAPSTVKISNADWVERPVVTMPGTPELKGSIMDSRDMTYFDKLCQETVEPLFGESTPNQELSEYFDVIFVNGPEPASGEYLLPDPSSGRLKINDHIIQISHPGVDNEPVMKAALVSVYRNHKLMPTISDLRARFWGFSKKMASPGHILAAHERCFTYNCSSISGSSGAPLFRSDSQAAYFCGIHIGGDFSQEKAVAYNYGYPVHHPAMVLAFAKYVVPKFKEIPAALIEYFKANRAILNQHSSWLGDSVLYSLTK